MRKTFVIVFALSFLVLIGTLSSREGRKGIPDTEIGLSKTSVFDTPAPEATRLNQSDPGDRPTVPQEFGDQPPLISHGIGEFLPVTFEENQCIACHEVEEKEPGEPTPIPSSHYVDLRSAPGVKGDEIVGARYNCANCHVSPGENEPLVGNTFGK